MNVFGMIAVRNIILLIITQNIDSFLLENVAYNF
jgi:hypothetical protein